MADERETLVRNMVAAGEPDDMIDKALTHYDEATHPIASAVSGFVGGLPGGLWGAVSGPFDVAKRVITDTVNAAKGDPSFTQSKKFLDSLTGLKNKWEKASPSERGEMVGNLVGGFAGGAAEGALVGKPNLALKPSIRLVGKGLQYAGEHPFAARMSGGAMLATGLYHGNPEMVAGGTAAMAAPALLTKAGRALREAAGEDLSEKLPSSATQNFDLKGNRVAPVTPSDPPAIPSGTRSSGYRISYGGGQPSTPTTADRLPSGARTLDVGDITGLNTPLSPAPRGSGYRISTPGSSTGPAPYRPAAKAAVRADEQAATVATKETENADKLTEIARRSEGMTPKPATVSRSISATDPATGERATSTIRMGRPSPNVAGTDGAVDDLASQIFEVGGNKVRPGTPAHAKIVDALRRQQAPPVGSTETTVEDAQRGFSGPDRRTQAESRPATTERRTASAEPTVAERAASLRADGIEPPADKATGVAMVNKAVQDAKGSVRQAPPTVTAPAGQASDADIIALRTEHGAEEAGTKLASDPRFAGLSKVDRTNAIRRLAGDEAGLAPASMQRDIDARLQKMVGIEGGAELAQAYRAKAPNAVAYKYITAQMKKLGLEDTNE